MNALSVANQRYAAKKYDGSIKIPSEVIEELMEVLRLAPSSINIQPWKFTFVQNPIVKKKLAAASLHNQEKIDQADLLIVFSVVDDLDEFQKVVDAELPSRLLEWYNGLRMTLSEEELKQWFVKQVYIALGIGLSACPCLGLDATPMEGIEQDKYAEILHMSDYKPILALAVGYAAVDDFNRPEIMPKSRRPLADVVEAI